MRGLVALVAVSGCGRIAFDPRSDAGADSGDAALVCPPTYTRDGTSCYRASADTRTWLAAEAACEADGLGAHLAIIDDAAEAAIVSQYRTSETDNAWIGVSDRVLEGTYLTVVNRAPTYLQFANGQPDGAGQNCIQLGTGIELRDNGCDSLDDYICEFDGIPALSFAWGACPNGYVFADQGCYREMSAGAMLTWLEAEAECESDGFGHLVVFETMAEFLAVDAMIPTIADYWIGGSDLVVEGTFRSVIDTPFTIPAWQPGQPGGGTLENCLRINMNELATDQCDVANDYVCEYDGRAPVPATWGQ